MQATIKIHEAVKRMRMLTEIGVPFSFSFYSYNASKGATEGIKHVDKAQLRKGYRDNQSDKADILIGYVNAQQQSRWFYLPLLLSFNGIKIKP